MNYNKFERIFRGFDKGMSKFETAFSVGCITLCGFILIFGILNRLIFKIPLRWTEEASRMLLILTIFGAQPIVCRERAHLKLAFLSETIKNSVVKKILNILSDGSIVVIFFILFVLFLQYTLNAMEYTQLSPAMGYPMWVMYGLCTLTLLDATVRSLMVFWDDNFARKKLFQSSGDDFSVN